MSMVFDTASIEILQQAFARFPDLARDELRRFMAWASIFLQGEVIDRTPAAEGALRDSVHPFIEEVPGGMHGGAGTALAYAIPVELGTKPHMPPIGPLEQWVRTKLGKGGKDATRIARAIQWKISHYGTPGAGMFHRALAANRGELARQFALSMIRLRDRLAEASQ